MDPCDKAEGPPPSRSSGSVQSLDLHSPQLPPPFFSFPCPQPPPFFLNGHFNPIPTNERQQGGQEHLGSTYYSNTFLSNPYVLYLLLQKSRNRNSLRDWRIGPVKRNALLLKCRSAASSFTLGRSEATESLGAHQGTPVELDGKIYQLFFIEASTSQIEYRSN